MKTNPELVTTPFATGDTETHSIPNTSSDTSVVTQTSGWQNVYSLPQESGGLAPERIDMNSIFYWITMLLYHAQKGWVWTYDPRQQYNTPSIVWDYSTFTAQTTKSGGTYTPKANGWFELYIGDYSRGYIPTTDDSAVFGKTYYAASDGAMYIRLVDYKEVTQLRPSQDTSYSQWMPFTEYLKQNIPVNDATWTLKKKSITNTDSATTTPVGTFTANQAVDSTVQFPVGNGKITLTINGGTTGTNEVSGEFSNNVFYADQAGDQIINLDHHVYDATLTVYTQNGSSDPVSQGTFSANQSTNATVTIPLGDGQMQLKTQQYSGTDGKTTDTETAVPGTSTFTANQSTDAEIIIPLGNAKTTLKLNGGSIGEWTANQYSDQVINIENAIGDATMKMQKWSYSGAKGADVTKTDIQDSTNNTFGFTANQSDSTDDIAIIPVGNGKTTFKCNGGTLGTIYADQSTDSTVTIPNINNGTITLKYAGTTLGSFTTNQSDNAEFDLLVLCGAAQPIGAVTAWAGTGTVPTGWLLCDGSEYSYYNASTGANTQYKQLYDVIGTTYGKGTKDTTYGFKVPNLNAKFIEGAGTTYSAGKQLSAGLPNIIGASRNLQGGKNDDSKPFSGALYKMDSFSDKNGYEWGSITYRFGFDASQGETKLDGTYKGENDYKVYGKSETVQPAAVVMNYIIRYI